MPNILMRGAAALAALILPLASGSPAAQTLSADTTGSIEFAAPTYANHGEMRASKPSRQDKASVYVWLPPGREVVPAVMIAHSIGGWSDKAEGLYVKPLLEAGYAVLGLDHFGGRGIKRAADVAGAISTSSTASDALLALQAVARHPRIDPTRVAIMGLSMGGITAAFTAQEFIRGRVLGSSPLKFAAHASLYGPCSEFFVSGRGRFDTGAPILLLYGDRDETTAPAKCALIEAQFRKASPDLQLKSITYAGAYHGWDQPGHAKPVFYPALVNTKACPAVDLGATPRFFDPDGRERPFDGAEWTACFKASAGYTIGYDAGTAQQSREDLFGFLRQHLKK